MDSGFLRSEYITDLGEGRLQARSNTSSPLPLNGNSLVFGNCVQRISVPQ